MPSRREDDLLADYLARIRAVLKGIPTSDRQDAYRELAQHVESLVDEAVSAGGSEEAVRAALHKFGDPERVSKKVVKDYWRRAFNFRQIRHPGKSAGDRRARPIILGIILTLICLEISRILSDTLNTPLAVTVLLGLLSGIPCGAGAAVSNKIARQQVVASELPGRVRWWMRNLWYFIVGIGLALICALYAENFIPMAADIRRSVVLGTSLGLGEMLTIVILLRQYRANRHSIG